MLKNPGELINLDPPQSSKTILSTSTSRGLVQTDPSVACSETGVLSLLSKGKRLPKILSTWTTAAQPQPLKTFPENDPAHGHKSKSTAGRTFAVHAADQGLIPDIPCSPPNLPGVISEHHQVCPLRKTQLALQLIKLPG